jgi:hypothetical protein
MISKFQIFGTQFQRGVGILWFTGVGVNFFGGNYGGMGVYTVVGRVRPRASGWVGVRALAQGPVAL